MWQRSGMQLLVMSGIFFGIGQWKLVETIVQGCPATQTSLG